MARTTKAEMKLESIGFALIKLSDILEVFLEQSTNMPEDLKQEFGLIHGTLIATLDARTIEAAQMGLDSIDDLDSAEADSAAIP